MLATHFTQLPFVRTSMMGEVVPGCSGRAEERSSNIGGGASLRTQGAREADCKRVCRHTEHAVLEAEGEPFKRKPF